MFSPYNSILGCLSKKIVHKGKKIHSSSCSFTVLITFARNYKSAFYSWKMIRFIIVPSFDISFLIILKTGIILNILFYFIFYYYFLIYLFNLFIFGCIGSLLMRMGFLQLRRAGATLGCSVQDLEHRLSSCGTRAQLLCGMWDPPAPGLEPMSPALAGRLLTIAPPGKPLKHFK